MKAIDKIYQFKVKVFEDLVFKLPADQKKNLAVINKMNGGAVTQKTIDDFIGLVERQVDKNAKKEK